MRIKRHAWYGQWHTNIILTRRVGSNLTHLRLGCSLRCASLRWSRRCQYQPFHVFTILPLLSPPCIMSVYNVDMLDLGINRILPYPVERRWSRLSSRTSTMASVDNTFSRYPKTFLPYHLAVMFFSHIVDYSHVVAPRLATPGSPHSSVSPCVLQHHRFTHVI